MILVGSDQPLLNRYLTNEAILESGHRQCRFNPEWFKQYPHLEYSKTKDAAFCFVCSLFSDGPGHEKSESVWVNYVICIIYAELAPSINLRALGRRKKES